MKQSILAYNRHCKKILSDKRILAYLLKVALLELKNLSLEEIEPLIKGNVLIDGNTHMLFPRNNEVYLPQGKIVFDLVFILRFPNSSNKVDMIINVELQNDAHPHSSDGKTYPLLKRATYYGSVALAEEKYYNLKEKYGIEGEAKGKELKLIENIKSLMKNLKKDYDYVASLLELDAEEKERYHNVVLQ